MEQLPRGVAQIEERRAVLPLQMALRRSDLESAARLGPSSLTAIPPIATASAKVRRRCVVMRVLWASAFPLANISHPDVASSVLDGEEDPVGADGEVGPRRRPREIIQATPQEGTAAGH